MSLSALVVMLSSWFLVLALTAWAWTRVLRAPRRPVDSPAPDRRG